MADDIKRVGLVFNADGTVDFRKSLQQVNSTLQENRNEFKLAKSTWDDSTKSSEKLRVTNEYLSKQYKDSADKVSILSKELQELESAENRNEAAIQKKKNQLTAATVTMNNYKKGVDDTNKQIKQGTADLDDYAKKLQNVSDKTKAVGSSLTKNVTAPIIAVGAGATAAWIEIDAAYDNIVSGTGATGDALESLTNSFDTVYGQFPADSMEVSNTIADLNTRFGFVDKELENASTKFLQFAKVNKTDVSSSIALVSRAMSDAGIDSSEYSRVLDALTASSQASGISIETLTENLTKYGAPMRALGFDAEESIAIFAGWEKAGVNTEIAFSGMKTAISTWSAEGKDARVEFQKTLDEIANAPNIADATTIAIEAFGKKAGPDLADAIQGGRFSIEDMMAVIEGSEGVVTNSFEAMQSPTDDMKVALNNVKIAGAELGDALMTVLAPILERIVEIVKDITEWFTNLSPEIQQMIVIVGAIVAAIGPLIWIIGSVIGAFGNIVSAVSVVKGAILSLQPLLAGATGAIGAISAPVIAIIAVIAAVIAALVQLWNTSDGFRTAVTETIMNIVSTLQNYWDTIIAPLLETIKQAIMFIWEQAIKPLWDNFVKFVEAVAMLIMQVWNAILPFVNWCIDTFGPTVSGILQAIVVAFSIAVKVISDIMSGLLSVVTGIINAITSVIGGIVSFITNVFTGNWSAAWNQVVNVFRSIFNSIINIVKAPINAVIGLINGMVNGIESGINFVISGINRLSFTVPDWVPAIGGSHFGFKLPYANFGNIKYLAKGGDLLSGTALVGEAGPELLTQQGNRTTVAPLSRGGGATPVDIIDYERLLQVIIKGLSYIKILLDGKEVGKIIDERILKVVM